MGVEGRLEGSPSTADVLDVRLGFAGRATGAVVEDTAHALRKLLRMDKELRFPRVSFLKQKSNVERPARRWLGLIRKGKKPSVGT